MKILCRLLDVSNPAKPLVSLIKMIRYLKNVIYALNLSSFFVRASQRYTRAMKCRTWIPGVAVYCNLILTRLLRRPWRKMSPIAWFWPPPWELEGGKCNMTIVLTVAGFNPCEVDEVQVSGFNCLRSIKYFLYILMSSYVPIFTDCLMSNYWEQEVFFNGTYFRIVLPNALALSVMARPSAMRSDSS